ncbi:PQQ-like beta-propeller repeat protein, partial [candidate division WOR-3 bacterium]|nr:PQQ-like beta-propeller repeat protein [candidate division WOR-3 bacterium]
ILWALGFGEEFVSSPALGTVNTSAGDRPACIVGVTSGFMPAIDCYQGEVLYNANEANNEEFHCSPAVGTNGAVYIGNANGILFAYDAGGNLKWNWPDTMSGDDIGATPVVDGNSVYIAGENGCVVKLTDNGTSFTENWRFSAREEIIASPVLNGSSLIVCDDSGYIYSLNATTGDTAWTYFADSSNITASPAINTDGAIYVGTEQGRFIALNPDGSRKWQYEIWPFATISSSPIISADGNWVYFGADNGNLYKLDAGTGQLAANWPVQVSQAGIPSTPALTADGHLYVQAEDNFLYCVSEAGSVVWSVELLVPGFDGRRSAPRRAGVDDLLPSVALDQYGIIYVASGVDGVFAIAGRPSGYLGGGPWPMFHHDVRHTGKLGSW